MGERCRHYHRREPVSDHPLLPPSTAHPTVEIFYDCIAQKKSLCVLPLRHLA